MPNGAQQPHAAESACQHSSAARTHSRPALKSVYCSDYSRMAKYDGTAQRQGKPATAYEVTHGDMMPTVISSGLWEPIQRGTAVRAAGCIQQKAAAAREQRWGVCGLQRSVPAPTQAGAHLHSDYGSTDCGSTDYGSTDCSSTDCIHLAAVAWAVSRAQAQCPLPPLFHDQANTAAWSPRSRWRHGIAPRVHANAQSRQTLIAKQKKGLRLRL